MSFVDSVGLVVSVGYVELPVNHVYTYGSLRVSLLVKVREPSPALACGGKGEQRFLQWVIDRWILISLRTSFFHRVLDALMKQASKRISWNKDKR